MATNFPAALDVFVDPAANARLDNPPHSLQHANANDAIAALQAKVGIDGSEDPNSLDYKITNVSLAAGTVAVAGTGINVTAPTSGSQTISNSGVLTVHAGDNVNVDNSDPQNPIVSSTAVSSGGTWPTYEGNGSPLGAVTPVNIGETYLDNQHGAVYSAFGTTNTSWSLVGGWDGGTGSVTGVTGGDNHGLTLQIPSGQTGAINLNASATSSGIHIQSPSNGFFTYTADLISDLPASPNTPAWGYTQDGGIYFNSGSGWNPYSGIASKEVLLQSAPGATPSIDTDIYGVIHFIDVNANITSMSTNLTGSPGDGDSLRISFTDDGTVRNITWGNNFESSSEQLPTYTTVSTRIDIGLIWNTETNKWRCVAVTDSSGLSFVSPAFTGTPTAPTAAPGTNNTQIATTAFAAAIATGATLESAIKSFNIITQPDEIVIAPSNSTSWANLYCTGTSTTGGDEAVFNAAVSGLTRNGRVRLLAGQYWRTNPFQINKSFVTIEGANREATIISPATNAVGVGDMLVGVTSQPQGVDLRDFQFYDKSSDTTPLSTSTCGLVYRGSFGVVSNLVSQVTALDGFRFEAFKTMGTAQATINATVSTAYPTVNIATHETWTFVSTTNLVNGNYYLVIPATGTDYFPEIVKVVSGGGGGTTAVISRMLSTSTAKTHSVNDQLYSFTFNTGYEMTLTGLEPQFSNRDGIVIDPNVLNSELIACRVEGGNAGTGQISRNGFWIAGSGIQLESCHPYYCTQFGLLANTSLDTTNVGKVVITAGEYESCPIGIQAVGSQEVTISGGTFFYNNSVEDLYANNVLSLTMGDFYSDSATSTAHVYIQGSSTTKLHIHDFTLIGAAGQGIVVNTGTTATGTAYRGSIHDGSITGTTNQSLVLKDVKSLNVHDITTDNTIVESQTTAGNTDYNNIHDNTLLGSATITTVGANSISHNNLLGAL